MGHVTGWAALAPAGVLAVAPAGGRAVAPAGVLAVAPAGVLAFVLAFVLAGCTTPAASEPPAGAAPSARAGFGGPDPAESVDEVVFRTPSKNIACALSPSAVRCDILRKDWQPPSKPADCELDWGNGAHIRAGEAALTCSGDTVLGEATTTLEYGKAYRSGTVRCDSESSGLTCKDEKTGRGFTLAVARYSLF
ncbi:DUF6636 domain-containing protein [Paractinoplanes rishiriensis]|uniref:Uncharacterized protein n=1 Tax=Paractinoplanes rishiriensis TaxID=1050105 RepID=A0A919JU00_9ACTN|nr:DUF6636 domain-containing protein [Actinoplanes rishiriensis]GIE93625.1 hypothetical protein Ari01nite_10900 [Actinoplanes rishiriensis]